MRKLFLILSIVCVMSTPPCQAKIKIGARTTVVFASADEGKKIFMARDEFIRRLSPFDLAARMKTDREIGEAEFLKFVGGNVRDWTENEQEKIESAFRGLEKGLEIFALPWPETIYVVKTTGKEEGGAPYTRDTALIFPEAEMKNSNKAIQRMICHELFHILSRTNPQLRKRLYEAIAFEECREIEFPAALKNRKITNPDAAINDHYIRLTIEEEPTRAIPILLSRAEKYDVKRGGEFFDYLQFQFLVVKLGSGVKDVEPTYDGDAPRLVAAGAVSGFFEQVGRNTQYIIHPEEILADNFVLLVFSQKNVPSPEILNKMRDVLRTKKAANANTATVAD